MDIWHWSIKVLKSLKSSPSLLLWCLTVWCNVSTHHKDFVPNRLSPFLTNAGMYEWKKLSMNGLIKWWQSQTRPSRQWCIEDLKKLPWRRFFLTKQRHLDHQSHRTKTYNLKVPSHGTEPLSGWTASLVSEGQKLQKPHLGHGEGKDCIEINTFRVFFLSKYFHWRKTSVWQTYKWFHTRFSKWMCAFFSNLSNLIL